MPINHRCISAWRENKLSTVRDPRIVMIGTSFETMGGVATVVKGYRDAGLFERCRIVYLASHQDGNYFVKFSRAVICTLQLIVLLSRYSIRIAHLHVASRQSFWRKSILLTICRLFGVRTILHVHGAEFMQFYGEESGPIVRRCIEYVFNHVDHIIVLSPQWKRDVADFTTNEHVTVIYNAVSMPEIDRRPDADAEPRIAFLGRLGQRKGIYDLLKAFQEIKKVIPSCKLDVAGDGELERAREYADELGLGDSVSILGWIDSSEREEILRNAALFVLPSYAEGLPMSLLEAMAAGLPVVTTNVGGIPDLVTDGKDGVIVEPGDVAALTDAIKGILLDAKFGERLGKLARERIASQFSIDSAIKQLEKLYSEMVPQ
jgi:glycosyltransferase involved in cell wall biosynthesis